MTTVHTHQAPSAPAQPTVSGSTITLSPAEPAWSLQARIAKHFNTTAEIANLPEDSSYGPFLDECRTMRPFDDPAFVVQCGPKTGLAAIMIGGESLALLDPLLSLNPWMIQTLKTMWHSQLFLWVHVDGPCPPFHEILDGCCWLSKTLAPVHDIQGKQYQPASFPLHGTLIQTTRFNQIKWPTNHC